MLTISFCNIFIPFEYSVGLANGLGIYLSFRISWTFVIASMICGHVVSTAMTLRGLLNITGITSFHVPAMGWYMGYRLSSYTYEHSMDWHYLCYHCFITAVSRKARNTVYTAGPPDLSPVGL